MALGPPFDLEFCDLRLQGGTLKKMIPPETWGTTTNSSPSTVVARGQGIFLVPSFVQDDECDRLMSAAAAAHRDSDHPDSMKIRLPIEKLPTVLDLCDQLIRRTLTLMEEQLPILSEALFGQAAGLSDMDVSFSLNEPAVNVYGKGAGFEQHEDGHMLTILVPLAEPVAFEGGGTAFWPNVLMEGGVSFISEHSNGNEPAPARSCGKPISDSQVMLPSRGTAMLFVGNVTHAGVSVTSGVRMVWVASFSLRPFRVGLSPMVGRLLVGNRVSNAKSDLAMQCGSGQGAALAAVQDDEREVYNGLRVDLRADLAAAAATAASELAGRPHHADHFEGLMDAMLAYRKRMALAAPSDRLQGRPLISVLQSVDET